MTDNDLTGIVFLSLPAPVHKKSWNIGYTRDEKYFHLWIYEWYIAEKMNLNCRWVCLSRFFRDLL